MEVHVARSVPVAASRLWQVGVVGNSGSETEAPIQDHHTNAVVHIAKLQDTSAHNLERFVWKLVCYADTFRVTAGEAKP